MDFIDLKTQQALIKSKRGSPLAPLDTICSIEEFYG